MPKLDTTRTEKKIILKQLTAQLGEECWIKLYDRIIGGDFYDAAWSASVSQKSTQDFAKSKRQDQMNMYDILSKVIIDWNLDDGTNKLDITAENIRFIPVEDQAEIMTAIDMTKATVTDAKKKS